MKKLLIFICVMLFSACFVKVPKRAKRAFYAFDYCYTNQTNKKATDKVRTDGYYQRQSSFCVFYKDGLWVESCTKNWSFGKPIPSVGNIEGIWKWGVYRVEGDTIKIRYLHAAQQPYDARNTWYLIEEREILNELIDTPTFPITEWMLSLEQRKFPNGRKFTFVQDDSIPDMNLSWFKRCKWLWCDKAAYEDWIASQQ